MAIQRHIEATFGVTAEITTKDAIREASKEVPGQMVETGTPAYVKAAGTMGPVLDQNQAPGRMRAAMTRTPTGATTLGGVKSKTTATTTRVRGLAKRSLCPPSPPRTTTTSGNSARSYLRQIEVWKRITRLPPNQLGLILYQHLSGKAWIAAEELSVARLSTPDGLGYFTSWVSARFLDLEVARIGRAFSDFFRRLRRKPTQTIREYNTEYDRLHGRLREVGCSLPEECAAWLYLDRLQLEESQELNLLASVGNRYSLHHLQHAAVLHDRGQRKPWESTTGKGRRANYTHMTNHDMSDGDEEDADNPEDAIPEEVAEALMTYQSAKEKYRAQQRSRGTVDANKGPKDEPGNGEGRAGTGDRESRLKAMKARSFCGGCGRRKHWHKDDVCPLNRGGGAKAEAPKSVAMTNSMPADVYALKHVSDNLMGVADTACARTVAGTQWLQSYTN